MILTSVETESEAFQPRRLIDFPLNKNDEAAILWACESFEVRLGLAGKSGIPSLKVGISVILAKLKSMKDDNLDSGEVDVSN